MVANLGRTNLLGSARHVKAPKTKLLPKSIDKNNKVARLAEKKSDIVKKNFPKKLEILYKTDVYIGVLLSDPPFDQKSRI